jgi:hypothetical protein
MIYIKPTEHPTKKKKNFYYEKKRGGEGRITPLPSFNGVCTGKWRNGKVLTTRVQRKKVASLIFDSI